MNQTTHLPDPSFVSELEERLLAEHRRLDRLGDIEPRRPGNDRWFRALTYTLAGVLLGVASVTTAQLVDEAEVLVSLRQQAEINVRLATERLALARRLLEERMEEWAAGVIALSDSALLPLRTEPIEAEFRLALARLDVEEIEAAGGSVRLEISAPRVGGRDFVSERLGLELDSIAARRETLDPVLEYMTARVNAGVALPLGLLPLEMERTRLATNAVRVRESLVLRQQFLGGEVSAAEAEIRNRLLLATARQQIATMALESQRQNNRLTRVRTDAGTAPAGELDASNRELMQAEIEAQMAQFDFETITRELALAQLE